MSRWSAKISCSLTINSLWWIVCSAYREDGFTPVAPITQRHMSVSVTMPLCLSGKDWCSETGIGRFYFSAVAVASANDAPYRVCEIMS